MQRPVLRGLASGVSWTGRTTSAQWGVRFGHTTVIDAAGAVYVIGGYGYYNGNYTHLSDVWASSDRGADPTRAVLGGYYWGTTGCCAVLQGALHWGYRRCTDDVS